MAGNARLPDVRTGTAKYKAVANMWALLEALYCTYQPPPPPSCVALAADFCRHCIVGTTSWHLLSLECHVDAMLRNSWPFGLAMFSGDVSECINCFHSLGTISIVRGGRGYFGGRGWMRNRGRNGPPFRGRLLCKDHA